MKSRLQGVVYFFEVRIAFWYGKIKVTYAEITAVIPSLLAKAVQSRPLLVLRRWVFVPPVITAGSAKESRDEYVLSLEERREYETQWEARDKTKQNGFLQYEARGEQYLSYYAHIDDVNWMIMTTVNMDQILQTQTNFWRSLLFLVFLLSVSSIIIHRVVSEKIGKPLDSFIKTFQKIKETSDYSLRMDSHQSQKMGVIAREVNILLTNVENNLELEKTKQQRLKEKASIDELTGLYNKETIHEIIDTVLDTSSVEKTTITCLFIDVDDFKKFNTEHGHRNGDKVLRFVAEILKTHFQFCGRMGGDEFVVCLSDTVSVQEISQILKTVIDGLAEGVILDESMEPVSVQCSIGIAFSKDGEYSCEQLLTLADKTMYSVKNTSKNGFCISE